jgi:hypothetical protein
MSEITESDVTRNSQYADDLRALADFYEKHPDIPPSRYSISCYDFDEKEDAARLVRTLGHVEKKYEDSMFYIIKRFGEIKLEFCFLREKVCTRRVVGTKEIPARVIECAARTEEIVEWDCEPVLKEG